MDLKEIETTLSLPAVDDHTKTILRDVALVMRINNLTDSSQVDKQLLIALIQKEPVAG